MVTLFTNSFEVFKLKIIHKTLKKIKKIALVKCAKV